MVPDCGLTDEKELEALLRERELAFVDMHGNALSNAAALYRFLRQRFRSQVPLAVIRQETGLTAVEMACARQVLRRVLAKHPEWGEKLSLSYPEKQRRNVSYELCPGIQMPTPTSVDRLSAMARATKEYISENVPEGSVREALVSSSPNWRSAQFGILGAFLYAHPGQVIRYSELEKLVKQHGYGTLFLREELKKLNTEVFSKLLRPLRIVDDAVHVPVWR